MNTELREELKRELEALHWHLSQKYLSSMRADKILILKDDLAIQHLSNLTMFYNTILQTAPVLSVLSERSFIASLLNVLMIPFLEGFDMGYFMNRILYALNRLSWTNQE